MSQADPSHQKDYFERVYRVVERIPYGCVTSYGAIAEHLGVRSGARMVGWALNKTLSEQRSYDLPCHRVVNREGRLTGKVHFTGQVMQELLRQEGVRFIEEDRVDMKRHFWHPDEEQQ